MGTRYVEINRFWGISDADKESIKSSYIFGRSIDFRTDPNKLTILPRTSLVSGSVIVDLPLWADRYSTDVYFYGNTGHFYKKNSSDTFSDLRTIANSTGNGMAYYGEDRFIYYASDIAIGRYGPMDGTPDFTDDYFGSESGVPQNTASLVLTAASEQYATAADHASLSQTGDITIELMAKITSLPAVDEIQTFVSKWNSNGNQRSYSFEIKGVSGYFGDGGDGSLTVSANTTQAPIDSACSGTAAAYSLSATNASFATGQKILIHQTRGTNAGLWERNEIAGYSAGTITLSSPLVNSYSSTGDDRAQVIVFPEYTSVTVNSGITWTAKAWTGTVGGILLFLCSGTTTVTGTISANGADGSVYTSTNYGGRNTGGGFRGGNGYENATRVAGDGGQQGESYLDDGSNKNQLRNNGGGGAARVEAIGGHDEGAGAGGGYSTSGENGFTPSGAYTPVEGGTTYGSSNLNTLLLFGSGGGGGYRRSDTQGVGAGGNGGGAVCAFSSDLVVTGAITSNGGTGGNDVESQADGGGGSGGSVFLKAQTATLGTSLVTATGGGGGGTSYGDGGNGRIHLDYYTSFTGTTSPTLDSSQDDTLITNTTHQLRLGISSNGTLEEFLGRNLEVTPTLSQWNRWSVTFDASASTATFYKDGTNLGTATGTATAIFDSTALFAIGARFDSSGNDEKWINGKVDDIRLWSDIRTESEININKFKQLSGSEANLVAYYKVNSSTDDGSANSNTLTLVNSATYSTTDVPFADATTRLDLDQSLDTSGNTYTLPTAIDEGATHRQSFVPAKDPQKSIEVLIAAIGSGDWTITVHDPQNRTMATATVTNANLNTGDYEFVFSNEWRPVIGRTYHFHLTSTVADGTVTTTTASDLETVDFHTYYQFLVDYDWHPMIHAFEKLIIGNERYVAIWDASTYEPHRLTLPAGFQIRCVGQWRDYVVFGIVKGDNIEDFDYGYLFFWDGTSDTYNYYLTISQGGINAIMSGDPLYFMAGYSGDLMKYAGGSPQKVRRMPKMTDKVMAEVYPGALNMWRSLVRIGFADSTDSSTIEHGVYTWGGNIMSDRLSEVLSYDYPLSIDSRTGTNIGIGLVYPVGSELLIGWKLGTTYGIDAVKPTNDPYPTATYESLITDLGKVWGDKNALALRGYFKALSSGDGMTLKYKRDRASNWTSGSEVTTADETEARLQIPTKGTRFDDVQLALDISTTNTTSPEFYGLALEVDDLVEERRV